MALSFDDRLLGEKVDNYCSSGDEGEDSETSSEKEEETEVELPASAEPLSRQVSKTGPKGVIEDYKQYKRLKAEQQRANNEMAVKLAKQCALTSRPYCADILAQEEEQQLKEILECLEDEDAFLVQYRQRRLAEMQGAVESLPTFTRVFELDAGNFVHEIDKEASQVSVIVHIYEENVVACRSTNEGLKYLCNAYPHYKFCRLRASAAAMSRNFLANGVPAILVYKNKELIGNLISIAKELDDHFTPEELETYLYEHGFLPPRDDAVTTGCAASASIRCTALDSDSD